MGLLIKNGEIVTATERYVADIWCEGETITRIGRGLQAPAGAEIVDATGKYVFPGFIDPHTHVYLPFMGTYAKDDYASASRAALIGGTTTIFDMCCPSRQMAPIEGYKLWREQSAGQCACDYGFHMGVSRFEKETTGQLKEIVQEGVASFKVFLAYKGALGIDDAELYQALKLASGLGVITAAHCENETLIAERQRELLAAGHVAPEFHHASRPPIVEAEGVHHLTSFAELTGAAVYIVHLSCREALASALAARARGGRVSVECLIQHLLLDKSHAELPNFEGAKYVMSPPLREKEHQAVLWDALAAGEIQTVATDHAPFDFATQKVLGIEDFTKIPNGIPSLEERVNLLFTYGVRSGKIDLHTFVKVASTQAAQLFGLYPQKGAISEGSDADLVVYDPAYAGVLSARTQSSKVDYCAFEGWKIQGRPTVVTLRGAVAVREGTFVGEPCRGRFLARKPTH